MKKNKKITCPKYNGSGFDVSWDSVAPDQLRVISILTLRRGVYKKYTNALICTTRP